MTRRRRRRGDGCTMNPHDVKKPLSVPQCQVHMIRAVTRRAACWPGSSHRFKRKRSWLDEAGISARSPLSVVRTASPGIVCVAMSRIPSVQRIAYRIINIIHPLPSSLQPVVMPFMAQICFTRCAVHNPSNALALVSLGREAMRHSQWRIAAQRLQKAVLMVSRCRCPLYFTRHAPSTTTRHSHVLPSIHSQSLDRKAIRCVVPSSPTSPSPAASRRTTTGPWCRCGATRSSGPTSGAVPGLACFAFSSPTCQALCALAPIPHGSRHAAGAGAAQGTVGSC